MAGLGRGRCSSHDPVVYLTLQKGLAGNQLQWAAWFMPGPLSHVMLALFADEIIEKMAM